MGVHDMRYLEEIPDPFLSRIARGGVADIDVSLLPRAPTRRQIHARRVLAAIGAVLYEAVLLSVADLSEPSWRSSASLCLGILAPLLVAGGSIRIAANGASTPPRTVAVLLLLSLVMALFVTRAGTAVSHGVSLPGVLSCWTRLVLLFVGPLLLAILAYRRGFAAGAAWRTVAVSVGCWGLAAASLELCCNSDAWPHFLLAHAGPVLLCGIIGLGFSRVTRT